MEPIAETIEVMTELGDVPFGGDLLARLVRTGRQIEEVVPDVVGMSVTMPGHGLTFTLVASDEAIALLDALQYLGGGPCVRSVEENVTVAMDNESMNEQGWHVFADATAAKGVASTLSLPVVEDGKVVCSVNLYGGSRRAFDGHHEQVAEIVGGWADGAITNADLSFSTRVAARRAPEVLRQTDVLNRAYGVLTAAFGIGLDEAQTRLSQAAERAGVEPARVARFLTILTEPSDD